MSSTVLFHLYIVYSLQLYLKILFPLYTPNKIKMTIFTNSKQNLIKWGFVHQHPHFSGFCNENLSFCLWWFPYEQYIMWHWLSEMNSKRLHAIAKTQKNQSKSETPLPIFQLSSLPHLAPRFSNFNKFAPILTPERKLDHPKKGERILCCTFLEC